MTFVDSAKIGIYGRSKGSEYSLMFLTKYDGIKCAVLNSPSDRVYEGLKGKRNSKHSSWTYGGKEISYKPFKIREFIMKGYKIYTTIRTLYVFLWLIVYRYCLSYYVERKKWNKVKSNQISISS